MLFICSLFIQRIYEKPQMNLFDQAALIGRASDGNPMLRFSSANESVVETTCEAINFEKY